MQPRKKRERLALWLSMLLFFSIMFLVPSPSAHAGFLQKLSELPADFDKMKQQYEETRQSLEDAKRQSDAMQQQLQAENESLRQQNEQLLQRIDQWEQKDVEAKLQEKLQFRRIMITVFTGIGLVLLYIIMTRVLRIFVWRRTMK
ncbi:hypothetical protein LQV63_30620 [Paenibacillus profundus]|uniref:Uncharacterized protein n=1 Tax=Paenibacillus profundus TaxID=1173085 RepID=A0ABS8YT77_9BACL|nr:cell envelope integrity protein TolA [Paenibacillus profundus]MCE5173586.1 hypothetical protein [Paenibacillus profundus]